MRRKQRYDFDRIQYNEQVINTITNSCITSHKTIEILLKNSNVFRPCNFRQIELNGIAKFEFVQRESFDVSKLFEKMGVML
jgi:BMFP domain-containing protein YqiC